jgi:threonine synthase
VGIAAAKARRAKGLTGPIVSLATAHPAKFPDAVERAIGVRPSLPARMGDLFDRPERITHLANSQGEVAAYMRAHARVRGAN